LFLRHRAIAALVARQRTPPFRRPGLYRGERISPSSCATRFTSAPIRSPAGFRSGRHGTARVGKGNSARIALSYHECRPTFWKRPEELARWAERASLRRRGGADAKNAPSEETAWE